MIARGESFEDAGDGYCDVVVPGRQLQPELEGLPSEVLTIEIESRGTFEVEHLRLHLHVIDPERHGDRSRSRRPRAAKDRPNGVLTLDRDAEGGVEGVGKTESGLVVGVRERARIARPAAIGAQLRQRRLEVRRPEERQPRDPIRRRDVLLHQHRRQRQHVRDVVEAVPGIVLRKVVRRFGVDAEKVANRVVVFRAVQAPCSDAPWIRRRFTIDAIELMLDPGGDRLPLVFVGLVLLERRHLGALQLADDLVPSLAVLDERIGGREGLEVQILLVLLVAVAAVAVLGEKRFEDCLETGFGWFRDAAGGRRP